MFSLPAKRAGRKGTGHDGQPEVCRKPEQPTLSSSHDVANPSKKGAKPGLYWRAMLITLLAHAALLA